MIYCTIKYVYLLAGDVVPHVVEDTVEEGVEAQQGITHLTTCSANNNFCNSTDW